jgi:hypothetical protein
MLAVSLLVCLLVRLASSSDVYTLINKAENATEMMNQLPIPKLRAYLISQWYVVNSGIPDKDILLVYKAAGHLYKRVDSQRMTEGMVNYFYCKVVNYQSIPQTLSQESMDHVEKLIDFIHSGCGTDQQAKNNLRKTQKSKKLAKILEASSFESMSEESKLFLALLLFHAPNATEPYPDISRNFEAMTIPTLLDNFLRSQQVSQGSSIMKHISKWTKLQDASFCEGFTPQENERIAKQIMKKDIPAFIAVESFRLQDQPGMTREESVRFVMALRARAVQETLVHPERLVSVLLTLKPKILDPEAQPLNAEGMNACFQHTVEKLNSINEIDQTLTQGDLLSISDIPARKSTENKMSTPDNVLDERQSLIAGYMLYRVDAHKAKEKETIKVFRGVADMSKGEVDAILKKIKKTHNAPDDLEGPAFIMEAYKAEKIDDQFLAYNSKEFLVRRLRDTPGVEFVQEFLPEKNESH